jgi:hypothetical protein
MAGPRSLEAISFSPLRFDADSEGGFIGQPPDSLGKPESLGKATMGSLGAFPPTREWRSSDGPACRQVRRARGGSVRSAPGTCGTQYAPPGLRHPRFGIGRREAPRGSGGRRFGVSRIAGARGPIHIIGSRRPGVPGFREDFEGGLAREGYPFLLSIPLGFPRHTLASLFTIRGALV